MFNNKQEQQLEKLNQELVLTGTIVIDMFNKSYDYFLNPAPALFDKVSELYQKVDERERYVERKCIEFIGLWKPSAKYLRISTMLLIMNREIVRIAELCSGITAMSRNYYETPNKYESSGEIKNLFSKTLDILLGASRSFSYDELFNSQEVFSAYGVLKMDKDINELRDELVKSLIKETKNHPEQVESLYALIRIIHKLERIADHSKNIASEVIYIVSGKLNIE